MTNLSHLNPESFSVREAALQVCLNEDDNAFDFAMERMTHFGTIGMPRSFQFWFDVANTIVAIQE